MLLFHVLLFMSPNEISSTVPNYCIHIYYVLYSELLSQFQTSNAGHMCQHSMLIMGVTIHKSHDAVRTSVFKSRFGSFFGTRLLFYFIFYFTLIRFINLYQTNALHKLKLNQTQLRIKTR